MLQAITILALLLCAEVPGEPLEVRRLVAQTVATRMELDDQTAIEVIFEPNQYYGVVNLPKAQSLLHPMQRELEWRPNLFLAYEAVMFPPQIYVTNFSEPGDAWEPTWCEVVEKIEEYTFYNCE